MAILCLSPAVKSLAYLQWLDPGAGDRVHVATSETQGICIMACQLNTSDMATWRALAGANLIEHQLSAQRCSAILHELHVAWVFETDIEGESELFAAIRDSTLVDHSRLQFQPAWLATTEPFDRPAVPAQAASRARAAVPAHSRQWRGRLRCDT